MFSNDAIERGTSDRNAHAIAAQSAHDLTIRVADDGVVRILDKMNNIQYLKSTESGMISYSARLTLSSDEEISEGRDEDGTHVQCRLHSIDSGGRIHRPINIVALAHVAKQCVF